MAINQIDIARVRSMINVYADLRNANRQCEIMAIDTYYSRCAADEVLERIIQVLTDANGAITGREGA